MALSPHILDETAPLSAVVLGIAYDLGQTPSLSECYDPKSKEHVRNGTFPTEGDLIKEMDAVAAVFDKHNIQVFRPKSIAGLNQIFARDIAFVVDDTMLIANMIHDRATEIEGIQDVLNLIDTDKISHMPEDCRAEGGDVMPWKEHLFVGYSEKEDFDTFKTARTNRSGLDHLTARFSNRNVYGFELNKSDTIAHDNALHLDCCFQPLGTDMGIIYKGGFKNPSDVEYLEGIFGKEKLIEIDREGMYNMNSNVFSISPEVVVSNQSFTRLNEEMRARGLYVEEVPYDEISKMEGLLRCTTLPLIRE